jgi:hypothetical protein
MANEPNDLTPEKVTALIGQMGDFSSMDEGHVALHEMFLSLQRGGFTENQALKLIANVIVTAGKEVPNVEPGTD